MHIHTLLLYPVATGEFSQGQLDNFIVVDCRYSYEYKGGHIRGAISINRRHHIEKFYAVSQWC